MEEGQVKLRRKRRPYREARCSADMLKWVGFACVCLGTLSTAVIQRGIIRLDNYSLDALYDAIKPGGTMMGWASAAVVAMLLSAVAIPIHAKLVYEGWLHTRDQKAYLRRLLLIALASEFCYDWAMSGKLLDMSEQNPVWALALCVVMLSIFRQLERPGILGYVLKTVVAFAAVLWAVLLGSYMGAMTVLLCAVFYLFAEKKGMATICGVVITLPQFPAPFGMFFTHFYDGTKGKAPRKLFYMLYPLQLVVFGMIGMLLGR